MYRVIFSVVALSLLTACAAPVVKDSLLIQQTASEQAQDSSQDVSQVLNEVRDLQVTAQREDLYFFSPTYIQQADEQLARADKALENNASSQIVLTHVLAAKQLLNRGLENKQTVIVQLKPALNGLEMLSQIDTPKLLNKDFKSIQDDTKDLIILIEQGKNAQSIQDLEDVLTDIHKLEIKTLKKTFLLPAENALEKAEDVDADDYAPLSYAAAKQSIEKFESFIENNAANRDEISKRSIQSIHLAQHAHHVAKDAKPLLKLNNEQAEQHILNVEKMLARIGTALNNPDVNHLPLDSQSIALAQAAETISKQAQALKNQGQWEKEKQLLEHEIKELKKAQTKQTDIEPSITTTEQVEPSSQSKMVDPLEKKSMTPELGIQSEDPEATAPAALDSENSQISTIIESENNVVKEAIQQTEEPVTSNPEPAVNTISTPESSNDSTSVFKPKSETP